MEAGEMEMRQAFEDVTTRNVRAILDHGNETRRLTKELVDKVTRLEGEIRAQNTVIDALRNQLVGVQSKVFSQGT